MVQRRDLNAPPRRKMAETVRLLKLAAQQGKTGASGVKDFGENGDAIWTNPDGTTTSVREIPPQIQEAKDSIEAAEGQIQDAKDAIAAEIAAREAALADALDQLAQLEGKLDGMPDSAELEAVRQQVAAAQEAVEAAQADATAAQQAVQAAAEQAADAQAAADTANANALAAAGIAADKGRIFYQADAPTGDDRSPNNLWIDSDNGRVHVWNGTTWEESQSEDLRDAAQAAVAAQQAAQAADQKAQDAAAAAAAADAKAQAAQGAADAAQQAAEGAQRTADQATTDARSAHNEAVAAQGAADEALAAYGPLDERTVAAQAAADAAAQAAEEARQLAAGKPDMDDVQQAITVSANGKNTITVSTAAPTSSTPGVVVGDTWWQVDTAGDIFGQWSWNGTQWSARTIRSEVIANLDVGKLTVTGSSRFTEAVVGRLFADIFTAHKITANEITIAALDKDGNLEPGSVRGVHIGDGQVSANKITIVGNPDDPDEAGLVANIASIMQLAVENLVVTEGAEINEAVILKLAAEMITSGVLRTAEAGQRVVIDTSGIVMYGTGADGEDIELVRIGPSGENLLTIGDTTVSAASVQSPRGSFDSLQVGGDTLDDILAQLPRGMRAWGELLENSQYDSDTGNYARRGELQTTLEPNRLYRIALSPHYIQTNYSANTTAVEELRYSYDAVPIIEHANPGSGTYRGVQYRHLITAGNVYLSTGMEFMLNTGNWSGNRIFWLMWLLKPEHGTAAIRVLARSDYAPVMSIEDMGPSQPSIMKRWNDGDGGGSQDTTPTIVRRTDTWGAGGYGGDVKNGTVYQGAYSSYGNRYGGWVFSSPMRSALSGSTIEKFEVYLENAHWYYGSGGTAVIVPNNGSYKGVTFGNTSVSSPNWPRYAGRWVTIPSSWYPYIANGTYKGVSTYTTNTGLTYYGQFKGSPTKFRVTYRK